MESTSESGQAPPPPPADAATPLPVPQSVLHDKTASDSPDQGAPQKPNSPANLNNSAVAVGDIAAVDAAAPPPPAASPDRKQADEKIYEDVSSPVVLTSARKVQIAEEVVFGEAHRRAPAEAYDQADGSVPQPVDSHGEPDPDDVYLTKRPFAFPSMKRSLHLSKLSQPNHVVPLETGKEHISLYPLSTIFPLPCNNSKLHKLGTSLRLYFGFEFTLVGMFTIASIIAFPMVITCIVVNNHSQPSSHSNGLDKLSLGSHGSSGLPFYFPMLQLFIEIVCTMTLLYFGRLAFQVQAKTTRTMANTEDFSVYIRRLRHEVLYDEAALREYFSQYGEVVDVIVAPNSKKISSLLRKTTSQSEGLEEKRQRARLWHSMFQKLRLAAIAEKRDAIMGLAKQERKLIKNDLKLREAAEDRVTYNGHVLVTFNTQRAARVCLANERGVLHVKKAKRRLKCCLCLCWFDLLARISRRKREKAAGKVAEGVVPAAADGSVDCGDTDVNIDDKATEGGGTIEGRSGGVSSPIGKEGSRAAEIFMSATALHGAGHEGGGEAGGALDIEAGEEDGDDARNSDEPDEHRMKSFRFQYYQHLRSAEPAPLSDDVLWDNLGMKAWKKVLLRFAINATVIVCIILLAGVTTVVDRGTIIIKSSADPDDGILIGGYNWLPLILTTASVTMGILISVCNSTLKATIIKLAPFEGHNSLSSLNRSVMNRIVLLQLFNSVLLVFFVRPDLTKWYDSGGGAETSLHIVIINAFISPYMNMLKIGQVIRHYVMVLPTVGQPKLDRQMQRNDFGMAERYANLIRTFAFAMCYGPMQPIIYPITIIAYINFYIADKIQIVYRVRRTRRFHQRFVRAALNKLYLVYFIHIWIVFVFYNTTHRTNAAVSWNTILAEIFVWLLFLYTLGFSLTPDVFFYPLYKATGPLSTLREVTSAFKGIKFILSGGVPRSSVRPESGAGRAMPKLASEVLKKDSPGRGLDEKDSWVISVPDMPQSREMSEIVGAGDGEADVGDGEADVGDGDADVGSGEADVCDGTDGGRGGSDDVGAKPMDADAGTNVSDPPVNGVVSNGDGAGSAVSSPREGDTMTANVDAKLGGDAREGGGSELGLQDDGAPPPPPMDEQGPATPEGAAAVPSPDEITADVAAGSGVNGTVSDIDGAQDDGSAKASASPGSQSHRSTDALGINGLVPPPGPGAESSLVSPRALTLLDAPGHAETEGADMPARACSKDGGGEAGFASELVFGYLRTAKRLFAPPVHPAPHPLPTVERLSRYIDLGFDLPLCYLAAIRVRITLIRDFMNSRITPPGYEESEGRCFSSLLCRCVTPHTLPPNLELIPGREPYCPIHTMARKQDSSKGIRPYEPPMRVPPHLASSLRVKPGWQHGLTQAEMEYKRRTQRDDENTPDPDTYTGVDPDITVV